MPYCWKCGAKLEEDTKFCPTCGTPIGLPVAEPGRRRKERTPISPLAIILIALLVIGAIITALATIAFLPIRTVRAPPYQHSVPRQTGVNTLNLDLSADVAHVNIAFEDLTGELGSPSYILNASVTARVGAFVSPDSLERFKPVCTNTTEGNVLTVTATQEVDMLGWPWYSSLNVTFDVRIDLSMNSSLDVKTSTGGIVLDTQTGVVLNSLSLEATTGGVEADLVEVVVIAGDVFVKTTTGGVKLSWNNVIVTDDVLVNAITTTGGVDVDVTQDDELVGNVTLRAEAVTGGVAFAIDIRGAIGAKIESGVTTGGIDIVRKVRFGGTESLLLSDNYPDHINFDVRLKTTTGGIDVDAKYTP